MREKRHPIELNRTRGARWRVFIAVVALSAWTSACAHTDEQQQAAREADRRELDLLRERVARLERQSSDTHAKLDRVIAKLDDREASVGSEVAPRREPLVERAPVSETVTPDAMAIASRSIDISRGSVEFDVDDTSASDDTGTDMRDTSRSAFDAPPIVIDADALRRLDARETHSGNSSGNSKKRSSPSTARSQPARDPQRSDLAATSAVVDQNSGNPKLVYKQAMKHFDAGRCDLAEQGFSAILTRAPDHDLADNALYWTGVCRQRAGRLEEARQLFADVPLRYPGSNKLADALFSLAEVHEAQGDPATARMYYAELVTRFPTVERAKEAEGALQRLGKR